jgi:hypothetical protein
MTLYLYMVGMVGIVLLGLPLMSVAAGVMLFYLMASISEKAQVEIFYNSKRKEKKEPAHESTLERGQGVI